MSLQPEGRPASSLGEVKRYYGCCEMCNAKMATEPMRYTLLRVPVAEAVVDKAAAVLLRTDT